MASDFIDVLYLDANNKIIAIDEEMKPGKVGKRIKSAQAVVEFPAGKIKRAGIEVEQIVEFVNDFKDL